MIKEFFQSKAHGSFVDDQFIIDDHNLIDHNSLVSGSWKQISLADEKLVDKALNSAEKLPELTPYQRSSILRKIAQLLQQHKLEIAKIITHEMGKTISEAKGEVDYAAGYFEWFADEAKRIYGAIIPSKASDKQLKVVYEPVGVVAVITPWNFPIAMAARKIGPAIAAGCSVIARPSTSTCLTMLAFAAIAKEAGLPKGALSILIGDAEMISDRLLSDDRVRKLTFTGSTEIGQKLYAKSVPTLKKVTMELGGHAPFIVFNDADLDRAAYESVIGKLRNNGQTCVCPNRFFIHKDVFEPYLEKVIALVKEMKVGSPLEESTELTNKLHPTSYKKVEAHIEDALKKGAKCPLRGKELYEPTILTHVTKEMDIFYEETFGPVFAMMTFETEEEVIGLANDTVYGLASYLFTSDINRACRVVSTLQYGLIGVNDGRPSSPELPFGGIKHSGFGREGGPKGIYEYLNEKSISLKL